MNEVRIGIAGFGGAGIAQFERLRALNHTRVPAIFDPRPPGQERARKRLPAGLVTPDFEEFLAAGIDAVSICSPNDVHAAQIVRSLNAGKHVICEKPLVTTADECLAVLRAERAAGRVLAVQHQMRFVPLFERVREAVQAGELGRVSYVEGYYVHNVTRRIAQFDTWVQETQPPPLLLSGCHFIDLMRWLLDDEVEEVLGMGNSLAFPEYGQPDLSVVLLRFRSGVIGKVVTAFAADRPQDHSIRVFGSDRCIDNNMVLEKRGFVRYLSRPLLRHRLGSHRTWLRRVASVYYDLRDQLKSVLAHGVFAALRRLYGTSDAYALTAYPLRLYEHALAVKRCLDEFTQCIATGQRPRATGLDGARTILTCVAGVEAIRSGRAVRVPHEVLREFAEGDAPHRPGAPRAHSGANGKLAGVE